MAQPKCRQRGLSLGRRIVCDLVHVTRPKCTAAGDRVMQLADVIAARQQASPRPSWGAIMIKAFALAAIRHPQMRQAYFEFPWGHIGEYESQVASVVVPRRIGDEEVCFLAPLSSPENQSLQDLDAKLRRYREAPIEEIRAFRETLRVARLPQFLRRWLLWLGLHVLPSQRVRHFGTFAVTTASPYGANVVAVPTFGNPLMHYGSFSETGEIRVGLVIDHRVMDGSVVGFTLMEMEQALRHPIRAELLAMKPNKQAA